MFETSQQEPSGGTTKLIGGVLIVAIVIMVVAYYAYFAGAPPAESPAAGPAMAPAAAANTPKPDADYRLDLAILRSNLGRDQTQTMAMWDIQISNRSREVTYRNIQYATAYYDGGGNVIHQGSGVIPGEMTPGDQRTVSGINDGLYPLQTARYTIEFTAADGFVP